MFPAVASATERYPPLNYSASDSEFVPPKASEDGDQGGGDRRDAGFGKGSAIATPHQLPKRMAGRK